MQRSNKLTIPHEIGSDMSVSFVNWAILEQRSISRSQVSIDSVFLSFFLDYEFVTMQIPIAVQNAAKDPLVITFKNSTPAWNLFVFCNFALAHIITFVFSNLCFESCCQVESPFEVVSSLFDAAWNNFNKLPDVWKYHLVNLLAN